MELVGKERFSPRDGLGKAKVNSVLRSLGSYTADLLFRHVTEAVVDFWLHVALLIQSCDSMSSAGK